MSEPVTVLGLGMMGGRAAAALASAGVATKGYDPADAARAAAGETGVDVRDTPEDALNGATLVLVSVPKPEHVDDLVGGALAALPSGTVVVDLSTIDPDTAGRAASGLARHGVTYLDAPVLGRPAGCGRWTLVAGGDQAAVDRAEATLVGTIAARMIRVGEVGSGSLVKLANNLMFGAINAVTAEALTLCRAAGVDPSVFVDAVTSSGAATVSNLFTDIGPRIAVGDDDPVFAMDLLEKDNRLAAEAAAGLGVRAPIASTVCALNSAAVEAGFGDRDTSVVVRVYEAG